MAGGGGVGKPPVAQEYRALASGGCRYIDGCEIGRNSQQVRLPREKNIVEAPGFATKRNERAAWRDERRIKIQFGGDLIAMRLDAILALDFRLAEVDTFGPRTPRQGRRITRKSFSQRSGERRSEAGLAFA